MNVASAIVRCCIAAPVTASPMCLHCQDVTGDWQGVIQRAKPLRVILRITKSDDGQPKDSLFRIDLGPDSLPTNVLSFHDGSLSFTSSMLHASYTGTLSADDNHLRGTWKQNVSSELDFDRATKQTSWAPPATIRYVTVDRGVKLEVVDWGGTGRPLVFLAGLGNTAHAFDRFTPDFTGKYHVYGIIRRGFGSSSDLAPDGSDYSADRLGKDVLAVLDALKLQNPVLVGHSIAGEELSAIGSEHPGRVAGLIYLDAGNPYALYNTAQGDLQIDSNTVQKELEKLNSPISQSEGRELVKQLTLDVPLLEKGLERQEQVFELRPAPRQGSQTLPPSIAAASAIRDEEQKFTRVTVPTLAIFARPHETSDLPPMYPGAKAAYIELDKEKTSAQAAAFKRDFTNVDVVTIPNANQFIYRSNREEVIREMNSFLEHLR